MKIAPFIACFLFLLSSSCFLNSNHGNPTALLETTHAFPDTLLEKGSDSDTSYFSLQVTNRPDSLRLDCTGWGIQETGMLLMNNREDTNYTVILGARCGTVQTRTWVKATLTQSLSNALVDSISTIRYISFGDTIVFHKRNK